VPNDAADHKFHPNTLPVLTLSPWIVKKTLAMDKLSQKCLLTFVILAFGAHGAWLLCDDSLLLGIGMKG